MLLTLIASAPAPDALKAKPKSLHLDMRISVPEFNLVYDEPKNSPIGAAFRATPRLAKLTTLLKVS
jgi:hypothetical protein